GKSVMLFLHKPLWWPDSKPGFTIPAADRQRLLSLFAAAKLRVVANGHMHAYRQAFEGEVLTVCAPSMTFAMPAEPGRGLAASTPGVIEYLIDGADVTAALRQVPGLDMVSDVPAMPEFIAAMAEIKSR